MVVFSDISQRKADELRLGEQMDRVTWAGHVHEALNEERMELHAQPIVELATGRTVQHELLIRMRDRNGALVIEFVRDLVVNQASQEVVRAIVGLARGFGQRTVAEGAEDHRTLDLLRELGVDYAQGYGIARPAAVAEVLGGQIRRTGDGPAGRRHPS